MAAIMTGRSRFLSSLLAHTGCASYEDAVVMTIHRMKREIVHDGLHDERCRTGYMEATTAGDLHDCVDANEYGGLCEDWWDWDSEADNEAMHGFAVVTQDAVHHWIEMGGLRRDLLGVSLGDRVRFKERWDIFPAASIPAGTVAVVTRVEGEVFGVTPLEAVAGLEEWGGEVQFEVSQAWDHDLESLQQLVRKYIERV